MVDLNEFVDFDAEEIGAKEKVRFQILEDLLERFEGEELKAAIVENLGDLILSM